MRIRRAWVVVCCALWLGCSDGPSLGTAVGNPGSNLTVKTSTGSGIDALSGSFEVEALRLRDCEGRSELVAEDVVIDATGGTTIPVPDGAWCGVAFLLGGPMGWTATSSVGTVLDLELSVGRIDIWAQEPFELEDSEVEVFLGPDRWLDAFDLGLDEGDVVISPDSGPEHDGLVDDVKEASSLVDARGRVLARGNEEDDDDGPEAWLSETDDEDDDHTDEEEDSAEWEEDTDETDL